MPPRTHGALHVVASFFRRLIGRTLGRLLPGKTERRLALVILLSAMAPLATALYLATSMFRQASATWFNPEIGLQLDRGVDVYKDLVKAIKDDLKHQTMAIASDPTLREAARARNTEVLEAEIDAIFPRFPELVALSVVRGPLPLDDEGAGDQGLSSRTLVRRDRGKPVDTQTERSLSISRPLTSEDVDSEDAPILVATFAVPRARLDQLESSGEVIGRYHQLESSRAELDDGYLNAFAALLGVTLILTVTVGILLARGVTRRIRRLGAAINLVAQGDLAVRVPVTGSDELTDLARHFNAMLVDMEHSRARIEFLHRIGAWQDMAQRLAHEIKNPLTPIQLAVQECHRKYEGDDPRFKGLLDTTLEVVEEEVGTLRRLVGNFSNFARLPSAELSPMNLADFLQDCEATLGHLEDPSLGEGSGDPDAIPTANVEIRWHMPGTELRVAVDRQMLRRVVVNLVRNAVQAIRDDRPGDTRRASGEVLGHVTVTGRAEGSGAVIEVEDDGPGIPESMHERVFDPYFTTKSDGTGLGLAIVKKIVVEHGGEVEVGESPSLGGARFVVRLPGLEILDITAAAEEARQRAKEQGVEF